MHHELDGRRQRSIATRAQILDAAEELFATNGYHATSLRSIARAIGMTHAGVLTHFVSKEAVLVEVLLRMEQQSQAVAESTDLASKPPLEQLRMAADHTAANGDAMRLFIALIGEAIMVEHPGHEILRERFTSSLEAFTALFGADGERLLAGWVGLQLLSLYLPDRIDMTSLLMEQVDLTRRRDSERALPPAQVSARWVNPAPPTRPQTRREEIIAAASELFARTGYGATSVREIAASLGTSHSALRYYFPSKESLLQAVLEARDSNGTSFPVEKPLDLLYGVYLRSAHNDSSRELIDLYSVLVCEATDRNHAAHEYFRDRFTSLIDGTVAEFDKLKALGLARPDVDAERYAIWAIAQWDGLQLHSFYGGTPHVAPAMLNSLAETLLVSLPTAVAPAA